MADPLASVTGDMPEPQEHAIQAAQEQPTIIKTAGPTDREGRNFNPEIHLADKEGIPRLNKDGSLRQKPGQGSSKARHRREGGLVLPGGKPGTLPGDAGRQIAESIFALGQLLGGEEWTPIVNAEYGINERLQMQDAWMRYCESKGISDVPPGIAVSIAMIGYIGPRFAMPKTKSRFAKVKEWCMGKYVAWRGKKEPTEKTENQGQNVG